MSEPSHGLTIMANLNFAKDVSLVQSSTAEGIGLYRTEFEFMLAGKALNQTSQAERYRKVIRVMGELPVHIRVLDIEKDKNIPAFIELEADSPESPCMGACFLLKHPEILREQARAMVKASGTKVLNVIYPMVMDTAQFILLKNLFLEGVSSLKTGQILHGPMLELPSACLEAGILLQKADFACIGSNDLVQYLFGIDRESEQFGEASISKHPVLQSVVKDIVITAAKEARPLLFCGELANDPQNLEWLLAAGIRRISVRTDAIPALRKKAAELAFPQLTG